MISEPVSSATPPTIDPPIYKQEVYTRAGKTILMMTSLCDGSDLPEVKFLSGVTIQNTDAMGRLSARQLSVDIDADCIADAFEKLDAACQLAARQHMILDGAAAAAMNGNRITRSPQ